MEMAIAGMISNPKQEKETKSFMQVQGMKNVLLLVSDIFRFENYHFRKPFFAQIKRRFKTSMAFSNLPVIFTKPRWFAKIVAKWHIENELECSKFLSNCVEELVASKTEQNILKHKVISVP